MDFQAQEIRVFDEAGAFVRTIGGPGQGPAEFYGAGGMEIAPDGELAATLRAGGGMPDDSAEEPLRIVSGIVVSSGDTVHVFDRSARMRWTYSPALELVGGAPLPGEPHWGSHARRSDGRWVIAADVPTEDLVGWPLHLVGADGSAEASFGVDLRLYRSDLPSLVQRLVAVGADDRIWSARVNEYRIELWGADNTLHRTLVREAPWFQPWMRQNQVGLTPRHPGLQGLSVDESGRIWALTVKPSGHFRDYVIEFRPGSYTWSNPAAYHSAVVEVIDPDEECVVASLETEAFLKRSLGGGMYAAYNLVDDAPRLDVWHLAIERE